MSKTALIAVGGNSLIKAGERGTLDEQYGNALQTAKAIVRMLERGWDLVISHGNGPQAGAALLRSERAAGEVYTHTLDMCVATTQSEIGYLMQRALESELLEKKIDKLVGVVPTMTLVDPKDPAYENPSKPIGPFYSVEEAEEKRRSLGWDIVEDASRGYRRVVPSPEPKAILQEELINKMIDTGAIVIALGGGGIPVFKDEKGNIIGSEAVIDKDRSSALLALGLKVDLFIISTDTDQAYLNYKKPDQEGIRKATADEMEKYAAEGHFAPGSMGPKVQSAIRFVRGGGERAIITSYEYLNDALEEKAGTHIVP